VDNTKKLSHISLCYGYGGIDLGLHRIFGEQLQLAAACEIEAYALENLMSKMEAGIIPAAPVWTDLRTFPWEQFLGVWMVSGGFPCQPFSSAGKRGTDADPRHLFPHILDGIRRCRPSFVFLENVEGIISAKLSGDDWRDPAGTPVLLHVLRELERVGYRAEAGVFDAASEGAPQQRKRVFILAHRKHARLEGFCEFRSTISWTDKGSQFGDGGSSGGQGYAIAPCGVWPSRPGQPQHGWEPPRVLADARCRQHGGREIGEGPIQTAQSELGEAMPMGNAELLRLQRSDIAGCLQEVGTSRAELAGDGFGEMGNSKCVLLSTAGEHGAMDEASGIPADRKGGESSQTNTNTSPARIGETMGDPANTGRPQCGAENENTQNDTRAAYENEFSGETEPALGRDTPRTPDGIYRIRMPALCDQELDEIYFWMNITTNRVDQLRLLGNGCVPQTVETAFRTLYKRLEANLKPITLPKHLT
jgi:DNA (cytosine-5)-methyltransferase 1